MKKTHQTQKPASVDLKPTGTGRTTLTPEKPVVGRREVAGRTLKDGDPQKNLQVVKPGRSMK